ncbi:hypothetical protein ACTOB_003410 [Actinoplanes oblitus]|uniref:Integral membrane protein n=1 Tax=Actinoplanes oblitus TaxID=3040509 RepID=A0ABY8WT26_9ACTN|nr:hypothetical protein [Actinoplanes oblitus]WIM99748.1 hypothetical protein ACTOB_003410 [Actinoplanes oblitus]
MNETIAGVLRRSAATRGRRILLVATAGIGALAAVALPAGLPPAQRTFAEFAPQVQLLISVPLPFVGVLLGNDLRGTTGARVLPTLGGATLIAVVAGLAGDVFAAAATAASASTAPDPWAHAGGTALAGVLVQVLAQLIGTGLGLLIAGPVWGCLATMVLPLGAYALLAPVGAARGWLTPYGAARQVLTGTAGAAQWTGWLVVALLWGVALNAAGAARLARTPAGRR